MNGMKMNGICCKSYCPNTPTPPWTAADGLAFIHRQRHGWSFKREARPDRRTAGVPEKLHGSSGLQGAAGAGGAVSAMIVSCGPLYGRKPIKLCRKPVSLRPCLFSPGFQQTGGGMNLFFRFSGGLFFRGFPVRGLPAQLGQVFAVALRFHVLFRNEFQ